MRVRPLSLALGALLLTGHVQATVPAEATRVVAADPALARLKELFTSTRGTLAAPGSPRFSALTEPSERGTRLVVGWLVPGRSAVEDAAGLADALGRDGEGPLASALPALGRVTSAVTLEDVAGAVLLVVAVQSTRHGVGKELELGVLAAVGRLGEDASAPAAVVARRVLTPLARAVVAVHPPEPPRTAVRRPLVARHVIERGDTLSEIAERHGLDLEALVRLNGVDPKKPIRPGDELKLDAGEPRPKLYVAKPGDTLAKVAKHFGVSEKALLEANRIEEHRLSPGQKLVLPR